MNRDEQKVAFLALLEQARFFEQAARTATPGLRGTYLVAAEGCRATAKDYRDDDFRPSFAEEDHAAWEAEGVEE